MKRIFTAKRIIIAILAAAAVTGGVVYVTKDSDPVSYMTEEARIGSIRRTVNATGEIGAQNLVNVGAQVSGQIERLYVELGQTVKKGDMIAQIDSTTQENDLQINKAKLDSYKSQLEAAQVALRVAQSQYEREKSLAGNDATSTANLENAENTYMTAKSSVTELQSQIKQAQISVNTSEVNLGYTKIVAPLDGTVVSAPTKEGQTVNSNQSAPTIVQIADLTKLEMLIQISEADVTRVQPGMKITYTVLSDSGKVYEGELKSIDPGLTTLSNGDYTGVIDSNSAIYYYGRVLVPNDDGKLHIGMTAQSSIVTESTENAIIVPGIAVIKQGQQAFVNVLKADSTVENRKVELGISDNMNTEVISGLAAGDKVITSQMSAQEMSTSTGNIRMPRM